MSPATSRSSNAASTPRRRLMPWAADDAGGRLARKLLPVAVLVPIKLAALCVAGERAGLYGTGTGLALLTSATVVVFVIVIAISSRTLSAADGRRREAEQAHRQVHAALEQSVERRTAQLQAANRELEAFSYSAAHDLRAPLQGLEGFITILLQDHGPRLDDDGRRVMAMIRGEARRMGRLVDDLLRFSHIGSQPLTVAAVDMTALARDVFEGLAPLERIRRGRFTLEPLPPAQGDATMLRQVWVNLLVNAVKFASPRDVPEITVGGSSAGGTHTYFVRDNGVGFDARFAGRLFEPFERLHGRDEFEGSGVGLALVHRIVARHGGTVHAEGKVDDGATFYFTLPARPGAATSAINAP